MSHTKKKVARKAPKKKARKKHVPVAKGNQLAVQHPKERTLSLVDPGQVMAFGKVLNKYILDNKLAIQIEGKHYPLAGAWKFAANNFGLMAIPVECIPVHKPGDYVIVLYAKFEYTGKRKDGTEYKYEKTEAAFVGFTRDKDEISGARTRHKIIKEIVRPFYEYKCKVEVRRISDDKLVQRGESVCSNMELNRAGSQESDIIGMAQTRTISRSLKNLLDFVIHSAGMESTPGEEMQGMNSDQQWQEAEEVKQGATVKKPTVSDSMFDTFVARAKKGEKVLEKVQENMTLTQNQIEVLEAIEKKSS